MDSSKTDYDPTISLLGIEVAADDFMAYLRFGAIKRCQWAEDLRSTLHEGVLALGLASKYCGRLAFLNVRVFHGLASVPIARDQRNHAAIEGGHTLVPRCVGI